MIKIMIYINYYNKNVTTIKNLLQQKKEEYKTYLNTTQKQDLLLIIKVEYLNLENTLEDLEKKINKKLIKFIIELIKDTYILLFPLDFKFNVSNKIL